MLRRLAMLLFAMALFMMNVATATAGMTGARAITGSCAARDARSDRLVAKLKAFVGKTDMGGTIEKTTMGLADVNASQVALVADKSICSKAAVAFDADQLQKRSSYTLYVVTLGSSYGVVNTIMLAPGYEPIYIFDKSWKYIGVK
ncbi:MAG: hypothetical protein ABI884_04280 [Gemmatimonadota bacterium]